jgi:hypothetical protein
MSLVPDLCQKGTRVVEDDGAMKFLPLLIAARRFRVGTNDPRGVDPRVSAVRWAEVLCFLVGTNPTLPGVNEQGGLPV